MIYSFVLNLDKYKNNNNIFKNNSNTIKYEYLTFIY